MNIIRTQWGGGGSGKHTHTHSVPRNKQGGWSLGQGSEAILAHVGVVYTLIRLRGYESH